MGSFEVMESGVGMMHKGGGGGSGISSTHLFWREVPKKLMSHTHTLQRPDGSAQLCLGVGLGVSDVPSSWGQWHQGRKGKDFFSHLLGLVLLGASRLLTGAVGMESKRVRALSPPQPPGGGGRTSTTVGFFWLQKQLSPSGSSSTSSILCHGAG